MKFIDNSISNNHIHRGIVFLLIILLFFIFLDEVIDINFIHAAKNNFNLIYLLFILQAIFAPLQSGFSDYFCRKKSIILSLIANFFSLSLISHSNVGGPIFLIIAIIIKGVLGNTLPMAWAAISDITPRKALRFALALSIFAIAFGAWISLFVISIISTYTLFLILSIDLAFSLILAVFYFQDTKDYRQYPQKVKKSFWRLVAAEPAALYALASKPTILFALLAFFFSEIAFYQIFFRLEVFGIGYYLKSTPFAIGIAYLIGTILMRFIKFKDSILFVCALTLISIIMLLMSLLIYLNITDRLFLGLFTSAYTFGYVFFVPSLVSFITSHKKNPHDQGKVYGIISSVDILASLATFIVIFLCERGSLTTIFGISAFFILISYICLLLLLIFDTSQNKHLS